MRREVIGNAELWLGDCRDVLPTLTPCGVLIFDPPYGIRHASGHVQPTSTARWLRSTIANDDTLEIRDFVLSIHNGPWAVFATIKRPPPIGFRGCLVWDKGPASGMGDLSFPWKPSWELIYIGGRGWNGSRDEGVLRYVVASHASLGRTHPNEKPVALVRDLIRKAPLGLICDPTMGTGATAVAAIIEGRPFVGIELDGDYFDIACRRIEEAQRQRDLFVDAPVPTHPVETQIADLFAPEVSD